MEMRQLPLKNIKFFYFKKVLAPAMTSFLLSLSLPTSDCLILQTIFLSTSLIEIDPPPRPLPSLLTVIVSDSDTFTVEMISECEL